MSISTKGPAGSEVLELDDGQSAGLSSASSVRIRANAATSKAEVSAFGGAYATLGAPVGTGNTLWVDALLGDDATAITDRQDKPYLTVGAALGASTSGDLVQVRPGTYTETGLTLPAGVSLKGSGWTVTYIGDAAGAANVLAMGAGCAIEGITVVVPAGAFAGIVHSAGTGSVVAINIQGTGTTGSGWGIYKNGAGKLIGGNIRNEQGGLASFLLVNSGVLALDDVHMPQSAGATGSALHALNTGTFQGQGFNCGNGNCTDGILMAGTALARIYSPNIFDVTNAVHFTSDGVSLTILGGRIGSVTLSVLLDPALTGAGSAVRVLGTVIEPLFFFPPAAAANTDFALQFNQEATNLRETRQRLIGGDMALGFPELGSALSVGRGEPYSDNIKVVTSDSTATSTTLGGSLTDVTAEAQSRTSSTFTFQGVAADHCIYIATNRQDATGTPLKHWGHVFDQVVAGVGGSYVCEIWNGSAWVDVSVMASSEAELYRYANSVFLRASSTETVQLGADENTAWTTNTVDGVTSYWTRWRIATGLTTAPEWERVRLEESSASTNRLGQLKARGLARWRSQLFGVGNVWGEVGGGGAADANIDVGSGGAPTGWTQKIKKGGLNSNGDSISFQFQIPEGICTAFPLYFNLHYSYYGVNTPVTAGADVIISYLVLASGNVDIADSAGAIVPVKRAATDAEGYESKAAVALTETGATGAILATPQVLRFGPVDISDYYVGDQVVMRIEMDQETTPANDLAVWTLVADGVRFTTGDRL